MKRPRSEFASRLFAARPESAIALLRAAWPAAVGEDVARRTDVVALDGAVLRIRVPDAAWQRTLLRMRGEILQRLREIAGTAAPRALGFVQGAVPSSATEPPGTAMQPPSPAPIAVVDAARAIPDAQVRAQFLDTAARYLARFRARAE